MIKKKVKKGEKKKVASSDVDGISGHRRTRIAKRNLGLIHGQHAKNILCKERPGQRMPKIIE